MMKKFLGLMVMVVLLIPITVGAKVNSFNENCSDAANVQTVRCEPSAQIEGEKSIKVTIIPTNVSIDVNSIESVDIDWDVTNPVKNADGSVTVTVTSTTDAALTGTYNLFAMKYTKDDGATDCHVKFKVASEDVATPVVDTPTENKKTGSTLPYIALGSLVVLAGAAYIVTKNQTKIACVFSCFHYFDSQTFLY